MTLLVAAIAEEVTPSGWKRQIKLKGFLQKTSCHPLTAREKTVVVVNVLRHIVNGQILRYCNLYRLQVP